MTATPSRGLRMVVQSLAHFSTHRCWVSNNVMNFMPIAGCAKCTIVHWQPTWARQSESPRRTVTDTMQFCVILLKRGCRHVFFISLGWRAQRLAVGTSPKLRHRVPADMQARKPRLASLKKWLRRVAHRRKYHRCMQVPKCALQKCTAEDNRLCTFVIHCDIQQF